MKRSEQQRKFLTVLPLLVVPFLTLGFWAMGGGNGNNAQAAEQQFIGLNFKLPGAVMEEEKDKDKLEHYQLADRDSAKYREQLKNDPYYQLSFQPVLKDTMDIYGPDTAPSGMSYSGVGYTDPNEAAVYDKLAELNKALASTPEEPTQEQTYNSASNTGLDGDIDRLEQMMQMMQQGGGADDPEMQQLNGMLERILDIQHPQRVEEKLRQRSLEQAASVFPVTIQQQSTPITSLDEQAPPEEQVFFGLKRSKDTTIAAEAIQAMVHETQTLVSGATVKLRLLTDVFINGVRIPKDHFVFGTVKLSGERMMISIENIRYRSALFPVELSAYDADGMQGIYIPGAITRDVAKQSGERAIQSFGLGTLDPSLGAQAASAGIETARSLLSKKVKLVKVTVKAGYRVWLKDEQKDQ